MDMREWFISQYDKHVTAAGDAGSTVETSRESIASAYQKAVAKGDVTRWESSIKDEGRDLFNRYVSPERERRKSSFRSRLEYLVDALNGDTILGRNDPIFDEAYPVGNGNDKCLGRWSAEDWQTAITSRYRNAAQVTVAARDVDQLAQKVIVFMTDRNARMTVDMFTSEAAA